MEEFDLKMIWQQSREVTDSLPSVKTAAAKQHGRSVNLIERIKRTARREHWSFLVAAGIGVMVLLFLQRYGWALGLSGFAALMIWKYEAEMRLFNRIRPENDTLQYLRAVRDLLEQFMRNYRIGFLIFIPLIAVGGALGGQYWATGTISLEFWMQPAMLGYLSISIVAAIIFSLFWLKLWVNTFYGKKLKEMRIIIDELEAL